MPSQTYDIFFSGQIMNGKDPVETRLRVGTLFKVNHDQLERMFSGTSIRIKSNVDEETASQYRAAFRNAGALIEIRPSSRADNNSSVNQDSTSTPQSDPAEAMILLPANTGSLEDCAIMVTPQPLPNISHISLASAGVILDDSPQPEAPEINTDNLSVAPANSGTLEDCDKEVEPYPIPDISYLDLDND